MCGIIKDLPGDIVLTGIIARRRNDGFVFFWPKLVGLSSRKISNLISRVPTHNYKNYLWIGTRNQLITKIDYLNKKFGLAGIEASERKYVEKTPQQLQKAV